MNDEILDTRNFLQDLSDQLHFFVKDHFNDDFVLSFQLIFKFLLLAGIVYFIDFLLKLFINSIFKLFFDKSKFPVFQSVYRSRISNSFCHLIALFIGSFVMSSIFYRHLKSPAFLERIINLALVLVLAGMFYRGLKALRNYYALHQDHYKLMAINAISETVKILGILLFSIVGVCVIFGIKGTTIVGSLGAITAVLVLVFRDTILGLVTGIHVATSKNLKVGDWVGIAKYQIEGTISEINLLTTKILNFDKTISTIPTYDLLSTEIKNLQVMSESKARRIKKSIFFNINSFSFLTPQEIEKLKNINLITHYLETKNTEIALQNKNVAHKDEIINGKQLTNIGVFRYYAQQFLEQNEDVDKNEVIMVRQLEITPQGLPLEIYCFANDTRWEYFERIQADLFDHLLVASKEFNLEIMQMTVKV